MYELSSSELQIQAQLTNYLKDQNERRTGYPIARQAIQGFDTMKLKDGQKEQCAAYGGLSKCGRCSKITSKLWPEQERDQAENQECSFQNFRRVHSSKDEESLDDDDNGRQEHWTVLGFGVPLDQLDSTFLAPIWSQRNESSSSAAASSSHSLPFDRSQPRHRELVVAHLNGLFTKLLNGQKALVNALPSQMLENVVVRYKDHSTETCDVCISTLFNYRLFCPECSLQVCERCTTHRFLRASSSNTAGAAEVEAPDFDLKNKRLVKQLFDGFYWPLCTASSSSNDNPHSLERLRLCRYVDENYFNCLLGKLLTYLRSHPAAISPEMFALHSSGASLVRSSLTAMNIILPHQHQQPQQLPSSTLCDGNVLAYQQQTNCDEVFELHFTVGLPFIVAVN